MQVMRESAYRANARQNKFTCFERSERNTNTHVHANAKNPHNPHVLDAGCGAKRAYGDCSFGERPDRFSTPFRAERVFYRINNRSRTERHH